MKSNIRTGSIVTLIVTILPVLLALMAYAIHVAYVESVQTRVQTVVDCAVRSAGQAYAETGSRSKALAAAQEAAQRNPVAGVVIPLQMSDLEFGVSDRADSNSRYTFEALSVSDSRNPGNSVRLSTKTLNTANPAVLQPVFPTFGVNAPIRPLKVAANTQGALDIALVLDRSGSMRWASHETSGTGVPPAAQPAGWRSGDPIFAPSRWVDTLNAVDAFVDYLDQTSRREHISVSTYASSASTELQLTDKLSKVAPALDKTSNKFRGGATAIGRGIEEGIKTLTDSSRSRSWAARVMVVMTDGIHNTGVAPENMIGPLQANGITLFTVTFGDEADSARMQALAEACGGTNFNATNAAELTAAFESIGKKLPTLLTQ
jgi:Ca-activated chloride channel homolog